MNKTELLNRFSADQEERLVLARVLDQMERAQSRSIPCSTQFLSPAQRAAAECDGVRAMRLAGLGGEFDFVVNTAPAPVLGERELRALPGAALIELASPPYGIDAAAAERLGRKVQLASGLPGKTAPEAAAKAVRDAVYAILREER